jgi:type IV pilus assembly protein PilX
MLKNRPQTLSAQRGVIMIIALIVLVAMTLGGIAMVRSVYTTNLIAGNLAFRESAVSSGDTGVEAAVAFLLDPAGCDLNTDCLDKGYSAMREVMR